MNQNLIESSNLINYRSDLMNNGAYENEMTVNKSSACDLIDEEFSEIDSDDQSKR